MTCKYKVKIKDIQYNYKVQMTDIQSKYKFKVFCTGYDDSEIKDKIDAMYQAFPKVSGEGETITLNDTVNTTMTIDLKGNTSQATTTQSKNLMPNEAESQTINGLTITKGTDGSLLINGTSTATTKIELGTTNLASGTYTLSTHKEGTTNNSCYLRTIDTTTESEISGTGFNIYSSNSKTYTLSENKKVKFDFYTGGNRTFTNFKIYPMAESGSTATDYVEFVPNSPSPDYPQDIHVVSGENSIKVEGKNLAYLNSVTTTSSGYLNASTGFFAYIESGETYTLSLNIASDNTSTGQTQVRCYTSPTGTNQGNVTQFNRINGGGKITRTFTSSYTGYLMFSGAGMLGDSEVFTQIQIEKGSTATTYEAYKGASYPINLGDIELCKIGNYQDSIVKDNGKWYLNKQIGKVVLNGSESGWSYPSANRFNLDNYITDYLKVTYKITYLSDQYVPKYQTTANAEFNTATANLDYAFNFGSGASNNIRFKDTRFTSVNEFKAELALHNLTIYYVLATPTTTEITDATLISQLEAIKEAESYSGQTNISQTNDDKPFILTAKALKDLSNL